MTPDTTLPAAAKPPSEFRHGWRIVAAAMVGVACGSSPIPYTSIGQLIGPIRDELGWSIGDISLAITIYGIAAACMAPVVGSLADRFGLRRVALVSLVTFGLSFASLALTPPNVWAWWIAWGLAGLVAIGAGPLTWTRGVNLWFARQRGLALGIALIGTSFTGIAVPQLAGLAIDQYGWRSVFPLLALLPFGIASAISPAVYGWSRDVTGDYGTMLHLATGMFVLGAVLLLFLGRYPETSGGVDAPRRGA